MKIYDIYKLSDFYKIIHSNPFNNKNEIYPIWYRGISSNTHELSASIFRKYTPEVNQKKTYSQINLKESTRFQHCAARTTQSLDKNIKSNLEWQEVYQHHLGNTRLLDWSESARIALDFALIAFLDTRDNIDLDEKRKKSTPVVWMLNPRALNEKVYEYFENNSDVIEKALEDLSLSCKKYEICNELKNFKEIYFSNQGNNSIPDNGISEIISLCTLDSYRCDNMARMKELVESYEFNIFYYLLLRYYSDGLPFIVRSLGNILPPLAILQPYHSERIRVQRGTFTIFPNYVLEDITLDYYKTINYDIRSMENQTMLDDCLIKINIINPIEVARGLILSGERKSILYPDIDEYINDIEAKKFYI